MNGKTIICSGALVYARSTKRFLLLHRTQGRAKDVWGLVGGTTEEAETPWEGLRREIFEEIGGFSDKLFAGEELLFSQQLKKECKKNGLNFLIFEDFPVVTSSRKLMWYSNFRILMFIFIPIIFPWALRFRSLCSFWYHRPPR